MNLTILMGPPGSGKSTFAKTMEDNGAVRISQDDEGRGHINHFYESIKQQYPEIVVDRMNFDKDQRARYIKPAKDLGYKINIVEFVAPRQVCFSRCIERQDHPTINESRRGSGGAVMTTPGQNKENNANSALDTYFSRYEEVTEDEGELLRIKYSSPDKLYAIMVDIDGTLANIDHRLHHVKGPGKKDWGKFFQTIEEDGVYQDVLSVVDSENSAGSEIILCSGRPEDQCRKGTLNWLDKNSIEYDKLIMRPAGNYKSDDITKAMLYRYEIEPYYHVKYILDDRDQVVNKWRSMGLNCFQVRPGNF